MKKAYFLVIVGFLFFVLIRMPAAFLLPTINALKTPYVQVQNVNGSIFSAHIHTTGAVDFVSYKLNPASLLLANLSFDVQVKKGKNHLQGEVVFDLISDKIKLQQIVGELNLALLQPYIPALFTVEPRGVLSVVDLDVTWDKVVKDPVPQGLSGNIKLLKFRMLGQDFGDYQLELRNESLDIIGVLSAQKSATTNTNLNLTLSRAKRQLSISGEIKGKNANTRAILNQLNFAHIDHIINLK